MIHISWKQILNRVNSLLTMTHLQGKSPWHEELLVEPSLHQSRAADDLVPQGAMNILCQHENWLTEFLTIQNWTELG